MKRKDVCFYYGKLGHFAKYFHKKKFDESKHKRHSSNFVDQEALVSDNFNNIKLFISEVVLSTKTDDDNVWFINYGASIHMTCKNEWFDTYHENNSDTHIYLRGNKSHEVKGYGDVCVTLPNGHVRQIKNVMYFTGIKKNLISVSTIANPNLKVEFIKSHYVVKDIQDNYNIIAR